MVRGHGILATGVGVNAGTIVAHDAGSVAAGDFGVLWITDLAANAAISVERAGFTLADGSPAPTDLDLVIATLDNQGGGTLRKTILAGDGATVFDNESGLPLAEWTNSTGNNQTVAIGVDNGRFNSGSGSRRDTAASVVGSTDT